MSPTAHPSSEGGLRPNSNTKVRQLSIPRPLIETGNPVAVSLFALIADQWIYTKQAVPMSRTDARRYDPRLSAGEFVRAIDLLTDGLGALQTVDAPRRSQKLHFVPQWITPQQTIPWTVDGKGKGNGFGRPSNARVSWVPRELAKTYIGLLEPCSTRAAAITRYTSLPLLSLKDIGVYLINYAAQEIEPQAELVMPRSYRGIGYDPSPLVCAGLLNPSMTVCEPPTLETVLRAVAKLSFSGSVTLTQRGWQHIGIMPRNDQFPRSPLEQAATGTMLFFVPPNMIESMNDSGSFRSPVPMIDLHGTAEAPISASDSPKPADENVSKSSPCLKDHEQELITSRLGVDVDVYNAFVGVNESRTISNQEWRQLSELTTQHGSGAVCDILHKAAQRPTASPIYPPYLEKSLLSQANKSMSSTAVDPLRQALDDIENADAIIQAGWVTIDRVTAWRRCMETMQCQGVIFSSPSGWLAWHLQRKVEPYTDEQAAKVAQRLRAKQEKEKAAQAEAAQAEAAQARIREWAQQRELEIECEWELLRAWHQTIAEYPTNLQVLEAAFTRACGLSVQVELSATDGVIITVSQAVTRDLQAILYDQVAKLLRLRELPISFRQSSSIEQSNISEQTVDEPSPGEEYSPPPVLEKPSPAEQPVNSVSQLVKPDWLHEELTSGWEGIPKPIRLLLIPTRFDAEANALVVPSEFHARRLQECRDKWDSMAPIGVTICMAPDGPRKVTREGINKSRNKTCKNE